MDQQKQMMRMGWGRFAAMVGTSTFIMFFLMYQLIYSLDHALFSLNRFVATLVMGCVMASVMLGFMWSMHPDRRINIGILAVAAVVFTGALWLVRSQITVDDNGCGLPAAEHSAVLGRFSRGSTAASGGSGLGLALVAQQAALHGGRIELSDSPLGGLRATLRIASGLPPS